MLTNPATVIIMVAILALIVLRIIIACYDEEEY